MKRIAILSVALLFAFTGIVYAASVNGQYDGHDVVKVKYEGVELQVDKVPGILYNGNTLVPLGMLRQAGFTVEWDGDTQTANIKSSEQKQETIVTDVSSIAKEMKKHNIPYVRYDTDGEGFNKLTYFYNGHLDDIGKDVESFGAIMSSSAKSDATMTAIVDAYDNEFWVVTDKIREYESGIIAESELMKHYHIEPASTDPIPNQFPSQPSTPPEQQSMDQCKAINDDYGYKIAMVEYDSLTQGQKNLKKHLLEEKRKQALTNAGC